MAIYIYILVPLAAPFSETTCIKVKEWLRDHIYEWRDFNVLPAATYLGFQMGPAAGVAQWDKPLAKYSSRSKGVALTRAPPCVSAYNYNIKAVPVLGYKAQLMLIPDRIGKMERPAALHVLHFATNAMDNDTLFTLDAFGGPHVKSVRAGGLAALARTARKTLPSWRQKAELIRGSSGDHSSLGSTVSGRYWDEFWDSPPIAITLEAAANHFTASAVAPRALPPQAFVMRHRAVIERASRAAERTLLINPKLPIQKIYYDEFAKALHGTVQTRMFERRLRGAFAASVGPVPVIEWTPAAALLRAAPPHAAVVALRTWTNSWSTTARYHDDKMQHCCLGCSPGLDSLDHYLVCEPLWRITSTATSTSCPDDVLARLCITAPSRDNLLNLVVACGTYHTLKMQYLQEVRHARAANEWEDHIILAKAIATNLACGWSNLKSTPKPSATESRISEFLSLVDGLKTNIATSSAQVGLRKASSQTLGIPCRRTPAPTTASLNARRCRLASIIPAASCTFSSLRTSF